MAFPRMQSLMDEYNLDIDDIRWYLSVQLTEELMAYYARQWNLIEEIWSGRLGDRLFHLEEQFLEDTERLWNSGQSEEGKIRDIFAAVRASKRRRQLKVHLEPASPETDDDFEPAEPNQD